MSNDQVVQLLIDLGPMILSITGAVLSVVFASIAGLARTAWKVHNRRMEAMAFALNELTKAMSISKENVELEHKKIWESVQGLRAEVHFANRGTEEAKAGLLRIEGALDNHRSTLYQHIEKLGMIDGKLSKLFHFVDAPRRATD